MMTNEGFAFCMGVLIGFLIGCLIAGATHLIPRIYQTISPLLDEIIEVKKKRIRDRYEEEKAMYSKAKGE